MATVANLNVSVTANTGHFAKKMTEAGSALGSFTVKASTLKKTFMSAGGAFGSSTLGNVASNIIEMGPAIGIAVGGMQLLNGAVESGAKIAADLAAQYVELNAAFTTLGQLSGSIREKGPFESMAAGAEANASKMIRENQEKLGNMGVVDRMFGFDEPVKAMIDAGRGAKNSAQIWAQTLRTVDEAVAAFKDASFEAAQFGEAGSLDRIKATAWVAIQHTDRLKAILDTLPEGGTAYNRVLDMWRENHLKTLDLEKQYADKVKEVAKEQKQYAGMLGGVAMMTKQVFDKMFEKAGQDAKSLFENTRKPSEKFAAQLMRIKELSETIDPATGTAFLDADTTKRAQFDAAKQFASTVDMAKSGGTFRQIDTSMISIEGLRRSGTDEAARKLELTNKLLQKQLELMERDKRGTIPVAG